MSPPWKWLILLPLFLVGLLEVVREIWLQDSPVGKLSLGQLFDLYLPNWPLSTYIAIVAVLVLLLSLPSACVHYVKTVGELKQRLADKQKDAFYEVRRRYDELAAFQEMVWKVAHEQFSKVNLSGQKTLNEILSESELPGFLPAHDVESLAELTTQEMPNMTGESRILWNLVCAIYRERPGGGEMGPEGFSQLKFTQFHDARRRMVNTASL